MRRGEEERGGEEEEEEKKASSPQRSALMARCDCVLEKKSGLGVRKGHSLFSAGEGEKGGKLRASGGLAELGKTLYSAALGTNSNFLPNDPQKRAQILCVLTCFGVNVPSYYVHPTSFTPTTAAAFDFSHIGTDALIKDFNFGRRWPTPRPTGKFTRGSLGKFWWLVLLL